MPGNVVVWHNLLKELLRNFCKRLDDLRSSARRCGGSFKEVKSSYAVLGKRTNSAIDLLSVTRAASLAWLHIVELLKHRATLPI